MPMTPLNPLDRTSSTFKNDLDSFFAAALPNFVTEANALEVSMSGIASNVASFAAGGAFALPYIFDTATADADPGAGKLRLSSATQNAATVMRVDVLAGGQDFTTLLDSFSASSSAVKGAFRLVKQGDPSKWMTFNMTARAAPSGYRNFTVVCTDSSSASPFANGDPLMLFFQRSGDKGEDAVGALQLLSSVTVSSAVAQIDFLNIFSSAYDKYIIELQNINPAVAARLSMILAAGGAADAGSLYRYKWDAGGMNAGGFRTDIPLYFDTGNAFTFTIEVRNVNSTGTKSIGFRGSHNQTVSPIGDSALFGEAVYRGTSPASGFRLFMNNSTNIVSGTIRVYGVKNVQ